MSKEKSRKSKNSDNKVQSLRRIPSLHLQAQVLAPIYDKVQLLRRQMENKVPIKQQIFKQQVFNKTTKEHFLEITVDRDMQIEKQRKKYESQIHNIHSGNQNVKKMGLTTNTDWKQNQRNKMKSLINFLASNKTTKRPISLKLKQKQNKQRSIIVHEEVEDQFQPLGEQYKRQKIYQESLKSQTQSLSSLRPESSLHSSKIGGGPMPRQSKSGKKYLRKGTRVREMLARQLQTPDQRRSTASSGLTYLKQYDQWVPTTLVEQKKAQLETFMNIIYGQKKAKGQADVDLNKIHLIYL